MSPLLACVACCVLCGAVAAALLLAVMRRRSPLQQLAGYMPGPPTVPLLGNALSLVDSEQLLSALGAMLREYGDVVRLWLGPELNVMVADPDDLKLLLSSPRMSAKGPSYKYMAEYIGGGILSGSGPAWRRHRKIASPNYGRRAIESYAAVFGRETAALLVRLRGRARARAEFDIHDEVVRATSYAVCQTLMALSKEETTSLPHLHELFQLTDRFYTNVMNRMTKWWYQIELVYWLSDSYRFFKVFSKMTQAFCSAIIEHRRHSLKDIMDKDDFNLDPEEDSLKNTELGVIDRFILSGELNHKELIEETFTIFTSSQEASAKIASFMLLMMAYHPEYQEILYSEISAVLGERGEDEPLTDADLKRMPYLDAVFKECVRLFPIGAVIQRTVLEDFRISSCTLPAGCSLIAPIYHVSRDPRYWERPDDFYPDHFSPDSVAKRPANTYIPFSLGPMDCLGRYFATKLIKTICAGVVREFQLSSNQTYRQLRLKVAVSVASVGGYRAFVHQRDKQSPSSDI